MRKCLVLVSLSALAATAPATEIYRWVDENGVIHYSDQPHPDAEEVDLADTRPAATSPGSYGTAQRTLPTNGDEDGERQTAFDYERLAVVQPAPEETLWNIAGQLTVRLSLQPTLRQGDRVRVYLDGERREVQGLQFELQEVWRGTHNLQAEIVNEAGALMIRSEPVRFYVHQTSIVNPN